MISEELMYPRIDAARSVLTKIGVDPATRDFDCQDYEYTTCNMSELERYVELYPKENTNEYEKRVLGCYIIEALNDFVSIEKSAHPLLDQALRYLHVDYYIHQSEIRYRLGSDSWVADEAWPIATYISDWQKRNEFNVKS